MAKSFVCQGMEDLSLQDMERLTVAGLGPEVVAKVRECGAKEGTVSACVVVKCQDGKVKAARWMLTGNLGAQDQDRLG